MITDHEDGPASGKFTKTFMKRDYVIKFMNKFVNAVSGFIFPQKEKNGRFPKFGFHFFHVFFRLDSM